MSNRTNYFQDQLAFGQIGEGLIARWLKFRWGYAILPVYEKEIDSGKGPQLFTPSQNLIAPDMLAMRNDIKGTVIKWVEAKRKTVFSWYRKSGRWVTGIDIKHFDQYLEIAKQMPWPVFLMFLHESSKPDRRDIEYGCPEFCPVGLFAGELIQLSEHFNHKCPPEQWGKGGMVYWWHERLKLVATLSEVYSYSQSENEEFPSVT